MYAIVDIETTGGRSFTDRIIEIAIVVTDGRKVLDKYESLVNPETDIPVYISALTGIHASMLYDAPTFDVIAKEVFSFLDGNIFVAHNVGFDYNFLKSTFSRYNYNYNSKRLCTVRLSRKIIPGFPSYSLGKLCQRLKINIAERHRAYGDALATTELFHLLLDNDNDGHIEKALKGNSKEATLPPNLEKAIYEALPEKEGVYYFLNKKQEVIYVGKAKNIKKRITTHFINDLNKKNMVEFKNEIFNIAFEETGNEFIAFLLESHEIKRIKPKFNVAQRRVQVPFGIFSYLDGKGYLRLAIDKCTASKMPLISFPTLPDARNFLYKLNTRFDLCHKMIGLETSSSNCTNFNFGVCKGACAGSEATEEYNQRVEQALDYISSCDSNMIIIGKGRDRNEKSVVCLENGKFLGFGYVDETIDVNDATTLKDYITPYPDNADIQRIIRSHIRRESKDRIIRY